MRSIVVHNAFVHFFPPKFYRMVKLQRIKQIQIQIFLVSNALTVLLWPLLLGLCAGSNMQNHLYSFWTGSSHRSPLHLLCASKRWLWNVTAGLIQVCLQPICIFYGPPACTEGEVTSQTGKGNCDHWKQESNTCTRMSNARLKRFTLPRSSLAYFFAGTLCEIRAGDSHCGALSPFRHPHRRPGFQKHCRNTAFCHSAWVQRRFISRSPQPTVLAAGWLARYGGRQGTSWCKLRGCPCAGHHSSSPGPEGLFLFLMPCNSHPAAPAFIHSLEKFDPL